MPLGFLSTGDSYAPGNYALLDLVAGLHYIRENIGAFGGDPNEVTLMGSGHGSAMVSLLLISPVTKGNPSLPTTCNIARHQGNPPPSQGDSLYLPGIFIYYDLVGHLK